MIMTGHGNGFHVWWRKRLFWTCIWVVVGGVLYIDWRGESINDGKRSIGLDFSQDFAGKLAL
jgi:hypothetical protein